MYKKVSVIIPCYNQAKYLSCAIESALNQSYKNIEIVVINDGSTDNSSEIANEYVKSNSIVFIDNKENHGVIFARNTAIEKCSGEYILPLDADDYIEPTYIEKAVKILDNNPQIGIVYCRAKFFGKEIKEFKLNKFNKSDILYENCIFNSALFRKKDFINVGMYKENMYLGAEDFDLWLSFIEQGFEVYQIDEILFYYRQHKKPSRTDLYKQNRISVWKQIFKNHIDLYLEDENFYKKLLINHETVHRKYKKYKKLFNEMLAILIVLCFIQLFFIVRFLCFQ